MRFATAVLLALTACALWAQTQVDQRPTIRLRGSIIGVVTTDDGEPLEGASLCTEIATPNGSTTSCGTQTNAKGEFEIPSLSMGKIGVYAENQRGGYWQDDHTAMKTVILTSELPTARVELKVGPKSAAVILNATDRETGKPVEIFFVRWIADGTSGCSGNGNFKRQTAAGFRVPIRPNTDVLVEVTAQGYKSWYFSDPSDPSRPILRLQSGEEKTLNAELIPEGAGSR